MPAGIFRGGRSIGEWLARSFLALVVLSAGYMAVRSSFAQVMARKDPTAAYQLARSDGLIAARSAQLEYLSSDDPRVHANSAFRARMALLHEPTAVHAVTTLGIQAQALNDLPRARELFGYAQRLSRRDLATQLWAIEDAVGQGDVPAAMHHYDIALRTSKSAPDVLFPVLAVALNDADVRSSVLSTLRQRPVWMLNFVNYVSLGNADPRSAAALFMGLTRAGMAVPSAATTAVINRLISANAVEAAWRYYAAVRSGADRSRSRDPSFTADVDAPSVFDWMPAEDPGISASIQRGVRGGVLDFSVAPSLGGILVRQSQMLPPGKYRLEGHAIGISGATTSLPYWILTCRDGREIARIVVPVSGESGSAFSGSLAIEPGCSMQTLALIAQPSDAMSGNTGQIDRVSLFPSDREIRADFVGTKSPNVIGYL